MTMLLAGDIGGTKSRLAIFADGADPRRPLLEEILPSGRFSGIEALIRAFLKRTNLTADRACFAIAGPVINGRAAVTNLPWIVEAETIRREFGFRSVRLLNDLAATARAVPLLEPRELHTLCPGEPAAAGAIAVIAPGTGLGEAFLTRDGKRRREHASEGGHADFAPGSPLETDLLRELRKEFDHVSYERVCSGPGLWRIYRFLRERGTAEEPARLAGRLAGADDPVQVHRRGGAYGKDRHLCPDGASLLFDPRGGGGESGLEDAGHGRRLHRGRDRAADSAFSGGRTVSRRPSGERGGWPTSSSGCPFT